MVDHVILTDDNIEEVMETTGLKRIQLENLLKEMKARGVYPVQIPLNDEPEWL